MTDALAQGQRAMESKGAYNRNAKLPAAGGTLAVPFLERATARVEIDAAAEPLVVADYGSSQGKNSLSPMRRAIGGLRRRVGPGRPIVVCHVDIPSNDFNTLIEVLDSDPERYSHDDSNIFPVVIGRSFYGSVLPPEFVHLGWCSYAAVWLSRVPAPIPGHFMVLASKGEARALWARQAARDWEAFLSLRAQELRAGGRLVVVLPAVPDSGASGYERVMSEANHVLADMVADGVIAGEERERMVLATYPRTNAELRAPFVSGPFQRLRIEELEIQPLPDTSWQTYQQSGDVSALASSQALFFRSVFVPSLASALAAVQAGDSQAAEAFADRMEGELLRRLAIQPAPLDSFVQILVLAKGA